MLPAPRSFDLKVQDRVADAGRGRAHAEVDADRDASAIGEVEYRPEARAHVERHLRRETDVSTGPTGSAERTEGSSHLAREELRLLPRRKVAASVELIPVNRFENARLAHTWGAR